MLNFIKKPFVDDKQVYKRNSFLWLKFDERNFLQTSIIVGSESQDTNMYIMSQIAYSKNNTEIFITQKVRLKLLRMYAGLKWLHSTVVFKQHVYIMFASISPVFTDFLKWAANELKGISKSNRWLSGTITATIGINKIPDYIFIPDITENSMIIREAKIRKIPIISLVNTDCIFAVEIPLIGSSYDFKTIVQITKLIIKLNTQKNKYTIFKKSIKLWPI